MSDSTAPLRLGEERESPDEARIAEQTLELVKRGLIETPQGQLVKRDAHPKAHGCVHGRFTVSADIPESLRHGIFAKPASYPVWIRFSNGNPTDDNKGDIRGMGIKLCQVPGEKILSDEKATQDFLLIADKILPVGVPGQYLAFFKAALNKNPLYAIFGIPPWDLVRAGKLLWKTFHFLPTNPLLFQYWSTTPYKLGASAVKYSAKPCASMHAEDAKRPANPGPNFLREVMAELLDHRDASFDFMVQPQVDPIRMPIEDAAVEWSEQASPFVKVGTIHIPAQHFRSEAQDTFCENLSINPWHTLPAHRPLGGINRVRRVVYENISAYRHERNGAPRIEPTGDERF
jgi:hypothetical protein